MAQIFLSYSRNDGNAFVAEVQRELETRGYETWRDIRNLHPDQDFTADIEVGIAESSHVVVCVTEDTKRNNSFVRREIQYALAIKKPVIPLRCHDTVPQISIINNEWVDFFKNKAQAVQRLTEILNDPRLQNEPGDQPADPFRPYLEAALQSIVAGLQQRIIRQIDLRSKATPDAVNAPERKPQAKPVDIFQLAMSGVKMGGDAEPEQVEAKTDFDTFAEAFETYNQRVLLMGEPGAGKTITLMAYAREAYAARLEDPTKPLPLFGLIPTWDSEKKPPLAAWLAETYGLDKAAVRRTIKQGRALLLLDGLDESGRERLIDPKKLNGKKYDPRLRFLKELPANNQILMTSRIEDYSDVVTHGEKAALNGAITLQPLGEPQMADYLAEQPELWRLIQSDKQLRKIATTPLLLSFFAFTYRGMTPEERTQLTQLQNALDLRDRIFLGYIKKRYEHEYSKVNTDLKFSCDEIIDVLGYMAMQNTKYWSYSNNILYYYDFQDMLVPENIYHFISLTLQLRILVQHERNTFRFAHLLLQDTLAYTYSQNALKADDRQLRLLGVVSLGAIKDRRAVAPLITALKDEDYEVRTHAANSLGIIKDKQAIDSLIIALKDEYEEVRKNSTLALTEIGDVAVEPLINALRDRHWLVRINAATALGIIRNKQAVEPLINLAFEDEDEEVCWYATQALKRIGTVEAYAALRKWRKQHSY